jgi:aryl-phospho-beta-D-glucosidase BglC (GH1 family)
MNPSPATPSALSRRDFLSFLAVNGAALFLAACQADTTPEETSAMVPATPQPPTPEPTSKPSLTPTVTVTATPPVPAVELARRLPRWRGFNLLEKFTLAGNAPYQEWDFDFMAQWGFDFVRLPTDYRIWTAKPGEILAQPLQEIDQAVAWGRQRKIHMNLCLHRAPGYCVNPPLEPLDLWSDGSGGEEARAQFADQWRMLAARYKGIPAQELSFDLLNEPADIESAPYVRAVKAAVEAIRSEDPERLILADGLAWGRKPVPELIPLKIAQSTRGYDPMQISHYKASWVEGSDTWPEPRWPIPLFPNTYLYGDEKPEYQAPLVFNGDFSAAQQVSLQVGQVSHQANLVIRANDQVILEKWYEPGSGEGEWKESVFRTEWNIYQAVYDQWVTASLPAGTKKISIELSRGDWITFTGLLIKPFGGDSPGILSIQPGSLDWAVRQVELNVDAQGNLIPLGGGSFDQGALWRDLVSPWVELAAQGVGVHVGEWGAFSYTPHAVTLAWMKDCLGNWEKVGFGWALWNLRGGFGILDSDRADVDYQAYQGHQLDRKMLEVLLEG